MSAGRTWRRGDRIAARSTRLPGTPPDDPADRMIIATALTLGAELLTKDDKVRRYAPVRAVW